MNYLIAGLIGFFLTPHDSRPEVSQAILEYRTSIDTHVSCVVSFTHDDTFQAMVIGKHILISASYWEKLDSTARKVVVLRELLHCDKGISYMEGISIMNRKITLAVNAYTYGAE